MPHASLKLIPGADRNRTEALNEAAIWDCNLIRFMPDRQGQGLPQKLGGWKTFVTAPSATTKALNVWADNNAVKYLGIGTSTSIFTSTEQAAPYPRAPQYYTTDISVNFKTTSGSSSVQITDVGSNCTSYNSIYLETPVSIGGLVLFGYYSCVQDTGTPSDTYDIIATSVIGVPQKATATVASGGAVPVFTPASGKLTISVALANHGYSVGSTFPIMVSTTVGNATLYGNYIVNSVTDANNFIITSPVDPVSSTAVTMNGGKARIIYFVGQTVTPPVGYGSSGYGFGGYGTGVSIGIGRTYTGASISGPVGTTYTITLNALVNIPVGSIAVIGPTGATVDYSVKSSAIGASTTTFTISSTSAPTFDASNTVVFRQWGFVMPDQALPDWSLDNWGSYLTASPHNGGIFYWNPDITNGYLVSVPNAPLVNEGMFIAMPERQIVAYGSSFSLIKDPMLVRWCDIADFTDWVATVVNQAGSYRIPKGSKIVGGIQGPQQGLLWTDLGVWSMQYVNQPLVYSFNEVGSGCGLIARKAVGTIGDTVYWMSQSQFFRLSGGGMQPIECPIWDVVFQNIDQDPVALANVRCAPNSRFSEITWFYPITRPSNDPLKGVPTHYVKYNTLLNQWDFGVMTRTAWTDQNVFGPPIGANSEYNSDTNVTSYNIYQHETLNSADGSYMDAYFQTGYFSMQEGDMQTFLDQLWPDMKWGSGTASDAVIKITFYVANYPGDTPRTYVFDNITQATDFITPRLRGRLVSIKVESSNIDSFWRLGNIRYRYQPDGKF